MKRLLMVAQDRALTRFIAEVLLERSLNGFMPRPTDPWDVHRAHTALEAEVLVTRGRRRFHAIIVDHEVADRSALELVRRLRRTERAENTPMFMICDRGQDLHLRRAAVDELAVAGFISRPVTELAVRHGLEKLTRKRRIVLVESDGDRRERYSQAFARSDFEVEAITGAKAAQMAVGVYRPDVAVVSLNLDDGLGVDVCRTIKRQFPDPDLPVVLYGQLASLPPQETEANELRGDDFVQAPFDDQLLVERVASLVGRGVFQDAGHESTDDPMEESKDLPTSPGRIPHSSNSARLTEPPPSAAPGKHPKHRLTRRVPCMSILRVREGDQLIESKTLDISHGGVFFEVSPPIPVGSMVDLSFEIPTSKRSIHAVGRVAWHGPGGVGVKFSRVDRADLHEIVDYVNQVSRVLYNPH